MNNDYEKQFVSNVYQSVEKNGAGVGANSFQPKAKTKGKSNVAFVVAVVAIIGMILELIIILVILLNIPRTSDDDVVLDNNEIVYEYDWEGIDSSPAFSYDEKLQLKGFSLKCVLEGKGEYIFDRNGSFVKNGANAEQEDSGEYDIVKSSAVVLKRQDGTEKVVYYNVTSIIEGLDFYVCEQTL